MTQKLIVGSNTALPTAKISLHIISQNPIDCVVYRLDATQKVRGDGDMIFYGQTQSDDGNIVFRGNETKGIFDIDLPAQPKEIEKIAVAFASDKTLATLGDMKIEVHQGEEVLATCEVSATDRTEKAVILAECYRRQGAWKFRFISQGFNGGLQPLSEYFGVEITDATPDEQAVPENISPVNLSKVTLTKSKTSISLKKQSHELFGTISINLNWSQKPTKKSLFGAKKSSSIDLDLGAFVVLQNGKKFLVQAVGGNLGQLHDVPYVLLRGDDRTGNISEGEWLDINGQAWQHIREIYVYAFIYEGVPNWAQTDGVVTIHVPNQPPVETQLTEGADNLFMCAIARLSNDNGDIHVERLNRYFLSHQNMDKAYGWGLRWKRGSK